MNGDITSASGVRMPGIIYGTAWKKADTAHLVELALRAGFRGIDTACQPKHYDEAGVGAGIAAALKTGIPRTDLYVQTKYTPASGQDPRRIPYDSTKPVMDQVAESFAVSQRNLRIDDLDCVVLHSPLPTGEQTLTAWRALEALVDAGGVRQIGISNCYSRAALESLYENVRIKPAIVQNRFHAETGYDRALREFCKARRIVYQSFWTLSANPHILSHAIVGGLSAAYGRTPAQILFRHLTQEGILPLTGTRSAVHMREDLSIFEFELKDGERDAINRVLVA